MYKIRNKIIRNITVIICGHIALKNIPLCYRWIFTKLSTWDIIHNGLAGTNFGQYNPLIVVKNVHLLQILLSKGNIYQHFFQEK